MELSATALLGPQSSEKYSPHPSAIYHVVNASKFPLRILSQSSQPFLVCYIDTRARDAVRGVASNSFAFFGGALRGVGVEVCSPDACCTGSCVGKDTIAADTASWRKLSFLVRARQDCIASFTSADDDGVAG